MSESDCYDFVHSEQYEKQLFSHDPEATIDYYNLYDYDSDLALLLLDKPELVLSELSAEFKGKTIRVKNLIEPMKIREIEAQHIGKLIQVEAIVITASIPDATIYEAAFECLSCHTEIHEIQSGFELESPPECPCGNKRRFKLLPERCGYVNTQLLVLQERPEELPPGEIPEPLTTILRGTLIRSVSAGDRVKIVGIVRLKQNKKNSLDYVKILEANSVDALNRNNVDVRLSEERIQQIVVLSQQPNLEDILINSYCPSIYGWRHVKKAILRCIFGGVDKDKQGSFVRGWINGKMIGDPGIAKTALLLFGRDVCQRGVYDTGRGVTGVGLTAALVKENDKFMLTTGTLGRADRGNAFIDEFEKMSKEDREVIHVPMENGIIPISKGGLRATLNSRCSVLAAMNPIDGRYNISKTLLGNIRKKTEDFPDSLISRFDWIFIMVDDAKTEVDEAVADKMLRLDDVDTKEFIPMDLLKDYIAYSKHIEPTIPKAIRVKMKEYYKAKRQEMKTDISKIFTPRQLESLERLIEARARMYLRKEATLGR